MTNKEFQNILAQYPDDYTIQMDNAFGWEVPSSKTKVDPHMYVNSDFGFVEIEPPEYRNLWTRELPKTDCECLVLRYKDVPEIAYYEKDTQQFTTWDAYNDEQIRYNYDELIAWFIIPKIDD